jgi:hypothetical protein
MKLRNIHALGIIVLGAACSRHSGAPQPARSAPPAASSTTLTSPQGTRQTAASSVTLAAAVASSPTDHKAFPLVIHPIDLRSGFRKTMDAAQAVTNVLSASSLATSAPSLAEQLTSVVASFQSLRSPGIAGAPPPAFAVEAPPIATRRVIRASSIQQGNRLALDDDAAGSSSLELVGRYQCDAGPSPMPVGAAIGEENGPTRIAVGGRGRLCLFDLGTAKPFKEYPIEAGPLKKEWIPQVACSEYCRDITAKIDPTNYVNLWAGSSTSVPRHTDVRESSDKLFGHSLPIPAVPLGVKYVASPSEDGTVVLYHPNDPTVLAKKIEGGGAITAAAFARHQDLLAIAEATTQSVSVWDVLDAGRLVAVFYGHTGRVTNIAIESDGKRVATAGDDGLVRIWNITSRELERTLKASPTSMAFVKGGLFVTAGQTLDIWDVERGRYVASVSSGTEAVCPMVANSPDEDYIGCSSGSQVSVYRLARELSAAAREANYASPLMTAGMFTARLTGCNPGAGGIRCSFDITNTSKKEERYRAANIVGFADGTKVKEPDDVYRPESSDGGKCAPDQTCTMILVFQAVKVTRIAFDIQVAGRLWHKQGSITVEVPAR